MKNLIGYIKACPIRQGSSVACHFRTRHWKNVTIWARVNFFLAISIRCDVTWKSFYVCLRRVTTTTLLIRSRRKETSGKHKGLIKLERHFVIAPHLPSVVTRSDIPRCYLNLKLSPPFYIGFKGKVKWSGEYGRLYLKRWSACSIWHSLTIVDKVH